MNLFPQIVQKIEESNLDWLSIAKVIDIDQDIIKQIGSKPNKTEEFVVSLTSGFWKRILQYVDIPWNNFENDFIEITKFDKISNILVFNWKNVSLSDHEMTVIKGIAGKVSQWRRFGRILGFETSYLNQLDKDFPFIKEKNMEMMKNIRKSLNENTSWEYWRNYLIQFDDGKIVIEEMERENLQLFNEMKKFDDHVFSSESCLYFGHPINIINIDLIDRKRQDIRIKVPVGTKDFPFQEYQTFSEWVEAKKDYWDTYLSLRQIKGIDFTDVTSSSCLILRTLKNFLLNTNDNGFVVKGYHFSKHIALFQPGMFTKTAFNDHYFCYIANTNVVLYITKSSEGTSNALYQSKTNIQIANIIHEELQSNTILQINVIVYNTAEKTEFCKACDKNKLFVKEEVFLDEKSFSLWYSEISEYYQQIKKRLKCKVPINGTAISNKILKNMFCYEAIECEDLPSFSACSEDQMDEQKKLVLLTPAQYKAVNSRNKHIILKGAYGSGKSLVLLKRFENVIIEMKDCEIAYLVCNDQQSAFIDHMKKYEDKYQRQNLMICQSGDLIGSNSVPKLSVLLAHIKRISENKYKNSHVFIDEFSGSFLDHEEISKLQVLLESFKTSHISISLQSMEERVSKFNDVDFFDIGYQIEAFSKKTSFDCYYLDCSLRNSSEIISFINATAVIFESFDARISDNNSFKSEKLYVDKELGREKNVYNQGSNVIRFHYNTSNRYSSVSAGQVEFYYFDKQVSDHLDSISAVYTSTLSYILNNESDVDKFVICTYDESLYNAVYGFFERSSYEWTNKIDQFLAKASGLKILLIDYASVRGYEFPNFIVMVPLGSKFLRYRLVECFSRATTKLYIIADNMSKIKQTVFKIRIRDDDHFDALDRKMVEVWKSLKCVNFIQLKYNQKHDELSFSFKKKVIFAQSNLKENTYEETKMYPWSTHLSKVYQKSDLNIPVKDVIKADNVQLLDQYIDKSLDGHTDWTQILPLTARYDAVDIMKILIEHYKIDIDYKNRAKETALHIAAQHGSSKIIGLLLSNKVDVHTKDMNNDTALHKASQYGHFKVVEILLNNKAKVNEKNNDSNTPMHLASRNGHSQVVEILARNKADINQRNNSGSTPLHLASCYGHSQVVDVLANNKANVNVRDNKNNTPFYLALHNRHFQVVKILARSNANYDVNTKNGSGNTPLHLASRDGDFLLVELLVSIKAEVNVKNKYGSTPLHLASCYGYFEIVDILLNHKAKVNVKNKYDHTPLHWSSENGHLHIVELLVSKNADVNAKNIYGNTPVYMAADRGHYEVVELLVNNKADVNAENKFGNTPLHIASNHVHFKVVEILVNNKADVNVENIDGDTPLHLAARFGHAQVVEILLNNDADVNVQNNCGNTPLHLASDYRHLKLIEILVNYQADVNLQNNNGNTPVQLALKNNYSQAVDILVKNAEKCEKKYSD